MPSPLATTTPPLAQVVDLVEAWTGSERLGEVAGIVLGALGSVLLIVVLALVASRLGKRVLRLAGERAKRGDGGVLQRIENHTGLDVHREVDGPERVRRERRIDAFVALLSSGVVVAVWTTAVMMILAEFGVSLAPLLASAGIVGLAIGFGAQDLVGDIVSGLFILAEDQYGVGDIVDVGEASGVVESITLRSTRLRDVQGTLWHVPNGEIRRVGNKSQDWARSLIDVDVAYGTDTDVASGIVLAAAQEMAGDPEFATDFLAEPEMWGVEALGADGVTLRLVVKVTPGQQWAIERQLRARIKRRLDEAGIEIPFPQRTLWIRRADEQTLTTD